ncbi:MAG: hypothetical protein ACOY3P_22660 [Planctomycetota bacterium]
MVQTNPGLCPTNGSNHRQRWIQHRVFRLTLQDAVRFAADTFFRFRYRAVDSPALWSASERVWLGRQTFLYWALWDTEIDIPRIVAQIPDAPKNTDELLAAIRIALAVYWERKMAALPRTGKPRWMPLP